MRNVIRLVTIASITAAGPLLAQDVDPVGTYEFTTMVEGQTVGGTVEITGTTGAWSAQIYAEGQGEIPLAAVEVNGSIITLSTEIPEVGELLVELTMDGEEFTGVWSLGFDGGELTGRRKPT